MGKKSESRRRRITATEASRAFASILDRVERGVRFVIRRRGRDVCVMSPPEIEGRSGALCLTLLRGRARVELDDRFGADLAGIVAAEAAEDRPSWDS